DLPAVEKWLARRAGRPGSDRPVYFSYFGSGCLDAFDLKGALLLPSFIDPPRRFILTLEPGTYLISATMLQSVHNRTAFGPWCKSYEDEYKTLAARINRIEQRPQDGAELKTFAQTGLLQRYDDLRLARLCGYLRKREPDERITFGILVYELNQAQLDQALSGPAPEGR
ncbi:MAG: hypothetical protein ABSE59_10615, partial [Opitutaceae bacterium]